MQVLLPRVLIFLVVKICVASAELLDVTAAISNNDLRVDQSGVPMNAHHGSLIQGHGLNSHMFFYYGDRFSACAQTVECKCAETNLSAWNTINVYSSTDLTKWRLEEQLFNEASNPKLRVFVNNITDEYVMVSHDPTCSASNLVVHRSEEPLGPFEKVGCLNTAHRAHSDWNLWADPTTQKGYIIYNTEAGPGQYLEEFAEDFCSIVTNSIPIVIGRDLCAQRGGCDSPLLFSRPTGSYYVYYALFGTTCACCKKGSEVFVYTASDPLGNYTMQSDINLAGSKKSNRKIIVGQSIGVMPLRTNIGPRYLWMAEQWQSTDMWSTDLQYWGLLDFEVDGTIKKLEWQDRFNIGLIVPASSSGVIVDRTTAATHAALPTDQWPPFYIRVALDQPDSHPFQTLTTTCADSTGVSAELSVSSQDECQEKCEQESDRCFAYDYDGESKCYLKGKCSGTAGACAGWCGHRVHGARKKVHATTIVQSGKKVHHRQPNGGQR